MDGKTMTKIKKLISQYIDSKKEVFQLFEIEGIYNFEDYSQYNYFFKHNELYFFYLEQEYSFEYANKIDKEVEGFVLFYIQDNGNKFYGIFDTRNLLTQKEFEERI